MKSTSTGALSFVMHVWWGIIRNRSRRSTRTGLSIPGMMMTIPGPFSAWAFPRRKFTIRSYSFTTLIVAKTKIRTMITRKKNTTKKPITSAPWSANTGPATSGMLPIPPIPLPRPWMVGPFLKAMGGFPQAAASLARRPYESIESFIPKLQVPRRDAAGGPTGDVGAGDRGGRHARGITRPPGSRRAEGVRRPRAFRPHARRHGLRDRVEGDGPGPRGVPHDHLPRGLARVHQRQARRQSRQPSRVRGVLQ